jgi:hypothetical protein
LTFAAERIDHEVQSLDNHYVETLVTTNEIRLLAAGAVRRQDWSIGGLLTILERYKGHRPCDKRLAKPVHFLGHEPLCQRQHIADALLALVC